MPSYFGNNIRFQLFGESHGEAIGVVIDGLPAGEYIDLSQLDRFMQKRAPGKALSTKRKEDDKPKFLSGVTKLSESGFYTADSPLCAIIENHDVRSDSYENIANTPRPSHADYTSAVHSHGYAEKAGGGHHSGRLTAPLCIAGGICVQLLRRRGIDIGAEISSVGNISDSFDENIILSNSATSEVIQKLNKSDFPVFDCEIGDEMKALIKKASENGDSVGGSIRCFVSGVECGIGEPLFGGIKSRIAEAMFGIPSVSAIEFGSGFDGCKMLGHEYNDSFCIRNGKISTETNHCGGIQGGISNGMPIYFKVGIKPTPSIAMPQKTVKIESDGTPIKETTIQIAGRHDSCITLRACPCVIAATACVLADMILKGDSYGKITC